MICVFALWIGLVAGVHGTTVPPTPTMTLPPNVSYNICGEGVQRVVLVMVVLIALTCSAFIFTCYISTKKQGNPYIKPQDEDIELARRDTRRRNPRRNIEELLVDNEDDGAGYYGDDSQPLSLPNPNHTE